MRNQNEQNSYFDGEIKGELAIYMANGKNSPRFN